MKTPFLILFACFLAPISFFGQNLTLTLNIDQEISCSGGSDGAISAIVSGEAAPVLYSWSTAETSASISNLNAGTYTLMVTDTAAGLSVTVSTTLTEPAAITASATTTNAGCVGGSITVTATGGAGESTFDYAIDGDPPQGNDNVFTNVFSGPHTIEIIDGNGCSFSFSVTVANSPGLSVDTVQTTPADCNGVGGSLTITDNGGGVGAISYSIDGTNFNSNPFFAGLAAGTYTVTVRDALACTDTQSVTIPTDGAQIVSFTQTDISCNGQSDGSVILNVAGGQNYSFFIDNTSNPSASFTGLAAGTYIFRVVDANGCDDTETITLVDPPALVINSLTTQNPACSNNNGSIVINASGGTPGYTYQLNNTSNNTGIFSNLGPGFYLASVQDSRGCIATQGDTLFTPTTLVINNLTVAPVSCTGDNNGSISLDATNAPGPYTMRLSLLGSATILQTLSSVMPGANATFNNLFAGNYAISVTDDNGCELISSAEVLQPNLPIGIGLIQSQSQTLIPCFNANTGQLSVQGVGGNGNFSFDLYDNTGSLNTLSGDTVSFAGLSSGMYGILLTDVNGCQDSVGFDITQVGRPTISFNVQDTSLCNQQDIVTYAGTGIYANAVFTDDNNLISGGVLGPALPNFQNDLLINVFISGNDTSPNACAFADTFQTIIHPRPQASFSMPSDSLFCSNESTPIQLVGSATLIGSATSIVSTEFIGNGVVDTNFFVPAQAGIGGQELGYEIIDNFACADTAIKKVFVLPTPVSAFERDSVCEGQATNFVLHSSLDMSFSNLDLQAFFNDNNLEYQILTDSAKWLFQGVNLLKGDSVFYTFERAGQASVLLVDTTSLIGCSSNLNAIVEVGDMPEPDFEWGKACLGDNTFFQDQSLPLQGVPRDQFARFDWAFGDGAVITNTSQSNPTHTYTQINCCYPAQLKITSTLGCVDSISKQVYILPVVDSYPYDINFENSDENWVGEGTPPTLWSWEELKGSAFPGGSQGWQTASDTIYPANAQAYLNSVCFDLGVLKRPALAMEIWSDAESADGTVLQVLYSDQDSADWFVLGDIDNQGLASGLNWYNSAAIFSRPGGQEGGLGWTGSDGDFQLARHKLDAIQDSGRVRFRLAFASDSRTPENTFLDGFGLDSVWIGERDRTLSIEAFTNDSQGISDSLRQWQNDNPDDAIVIRYPLDGIYFDNNPAPPRARSLYYGISVPEQIVMDGSAYNASLLDFSQDLISLRSLVAANFQIRIDTLNTSTPIALTALQDFTDDQELIVSVLVVEEDADQVMVVRKMLPDPAGISFYGWEVNQTRSLAAQWQEEDLPSPKIVDDYNSLSVVVMIQDQTTKEILQSAISPIWSGLLDPVLIQRKGSPSTIVDMADVYPNPSTGVFTIAFGVPDPGQKTIQVWDMQGRTVYQEVVSGEINEWKLNLRSLAAGVYQLSVKRGNGESIIQERLIKSPTN